MSKTNGSKSFPSAELILYTLLFYIYIILRAEGNSTPSMSSSVHYYMLCAYRLPYPRSAPISTESTTCSLDLLRMLPTGSLQPASTFSFTLYYTLSYDFDRCGCTLLAAWLSDSYGHDLYQIRSLD
jgi:hypothetical protein